MQKQTHKQMQVIFISGTTASGKSQLALELAEKFNGAIINCDSIQVYRELAIGAAKPTAAEFERVPHFLFDFVSHPRVYTAGDYSRDFDECVEKLETQFPVVFVVGGTGFYFQAIEKGMFDAGKTRPEVMEQLRLELEEVGGPAKLYQELAACDSETAQVIHPHDYYRLQRALGIWRSEGKTVTELRKNQAVKKFKYPLQKYALKIDKNVLERKIALRTQTMLEQGLIREVETLLSREGYRDWLPLQSVGYREAIDFIDGRIRNEKELKEKIVIATRQLAKKQRTWFQRDSELVWLDPAEAVSKISHKITGELCHSTN